MKNKRTKNLPKVTPPAPWVSLLVSCTHCHPSGIRYAKRLPKPVKDAKVHCIFCDRPIAFTWYNSDLMDYQWVPYAENGQLLYAIEYSKD